MIRRGRMIVIEGPDGSGKSTQVERIVAWLESRQLEVVRIREPGGTPASEAVRSVLLEHRWGGLEELLLFMAARAQVVSQVIRPALLTGQIVIADRFVDSTEAYQIDGRKLSRLRTLYRDLTREVCGDVEPDLTVILDLASSISRERTRRRGSENRLDQEVVEFHDRVGEAYRRFGRYKPGHVLVDANRDPDTVFADLAMHIRKVLGRDDL